jgi:hypothetical protein
MNYSIGETVFAKLFDSKSVLCSSDKSSSYKYLEPLEALHYTFVRFGNEHFIPSLSIDVDFALSDREIKRLCADLKIPRPSFSVKTEKGKHIHWVLSHPVSTYNSKALSYYNKILTLLITTFRGDKNAVQNASGRVWRNPIVHPTTVYRKTPVTLDMFKGLLYLSLKTQKDIIQSISPKSVSVNLKTVKEGDRNCSLFDYTREIVYKKASMLDRDLTFDEVFYVANTGNSVLPSKLPEKEVISIAKSVLKFANSKLNGKRVPNEDRVEYNRKLARSKAKKTENAILTAFLSNPALTIKGLLKMSLRRASVILNLPKSTIQDNKHRIKEILLSATKNHDLPSWVELNFCAKKLCTHTVENFALFSTGATKTDNISINSPP